MRSRFLTYIFTLFPLSNLVFAQDVIEVPRTNVSSVYTETLTKLENLRNKPEEALKLLTSTMSQLTNPFGRFYLIFWEIPALYCELKKFIEGFEVLKMGQKEGLFYPFILGQNKFPPYIGNFEKLDYFKSFLDENKKLREAAQRNSKFEYVVQLPKNYSRDKQYPLIIILYEGFGKRKESR